MPIPKGNKIIMAVAITLIIATPFWVWNFPPPSWVKPTAGALAVVGLIAYLIVRFRGMGQASRK